MSAKVAINGLGRIGRAILKLVIDEPAFEPVAVNDLAGADQLAYLLRFDTVYGRYGKPVAVDLELTKVIDGDLVKVMSWYDNEWGYANQMVREALSLAGRR